MITGKKYHYLVKYLVLALPIVLLLLALFIPIKESVDSSDYKTETITNEVIHYKYNTNDVANVDDFIDGNLYYIPFLDIQSLTSSTNYYFISNTFYLFDVSDDDGEIYDLIINDTLGSWLVLSYYNDIYTIDFDGYYNFQFYTSSLLESSSLFNIEFDLNEYVGVVSSVPNELMPVDYIEKTNNTTIAYNDRVKYEVNKMATTFKEMSINNWYGRLVELLGFKEYSDTFIGSIMIYYPLWCLWVYVFDIILDLLGMALRLGHKFISKFGGDY